MKADGRQGEQTAAVFLNGRGYRILARNYRCRFGEIDLIADQGGILCFIEVKSRSHARFGVPADAVRRGKQRKIINCALHYLQTVRGTTDVACRFDVVSLLPGQLPELIPGAFVLTR